MLQYALNDAKIVINLFLVFKRLAEYITNNMEDNIFLDNMIIKFVENRENINLFKQNKKFDNFNKIFFEIHLKCLELIKQKLKDKYVKLNILNTN